MKIKEVIENLTPVMISPKSSSITLSISKRFFLFRMMNKIIRVIEEDPHLNFVALLKSYKVLGRILHGTVYEFYRDRNKLYFKNFFYDKKLYHSVKHDLEFLHREYGDIKMTITKRGVIIYDNYKKNAFNVLLLTVHSGNWIPEKVAKKMHVSTKKRHQEEDRDTHKIYSPLVLQKGGIWIDNKQSRFLIDFNRNGERAIYKDNSEKWIESVWKKPLTAAEVKETYKSYYQFYFTLARLVETYQFNIIFDGHSMNPKPGRPEISFGTEYTPDFYMPIVKGMRRKMKSLGYKSVLFNTPYSGGNIVKWLKEKFPSTFIFSMEVNKSLYTTHDQLKSKDSKIAKLADHIPMIFDIEVDDGTD